MQRLYNQRYQRHFQQFPKWHEYDLALPQIGAIQYFFERFFI